MSYKSVDQLQKTLAENVFHYAKDAKKASGRALGTLVEIITFYLLKSWGFEKHLAIERPLPEYMNTDITHNVEYSLHPSTKLKDIEFDIDELPISSNKILESMDVKSTKTSNQLLTKDFVLRNSCVIGEVKNDYMVSVLKGLSNKKIFVETNLLRKKPFAIFECKRVGIEEGMKKGPQTIEKAKQGAYVARTVSSLQKFRYKDGMTGGIIHREDGTLYCKEYNKIFEEIISSTEKDLLKDFIMTVGVVSNHGNWFTSENYNKELKVLAQSYDWLLFLTDQGLSNFIEKLLFKPEKKHIAIKNSFLASYTGKSGKNQFTKVQMHIEADGALREYFLKNNDEIQGWFNIITPERKKISDLKKQIAILANKNWKEILE